MTKTRWMVVLLSVMAFAAGVASALVGRQLAKPAVEPAAARARGSWLATELNLSPQQREDMARIWNNPATEGTPNEGDRRRE